MPSGTKSKKGKRQSGDPRKISSAKEWRRRNEGQVVELPSGNTALCVRIGMQAFLAKGTVPNYLKPLVDEIIREKSYLPPEKQKELVDDPEALIQTAEMIDRCLVATVIEPVVLMPPGCGLCGKYRNYQDGDVHNREAPVFDHDYIQAERDENVVYADEVAFEDKTFLFQWSVGGGADLETFREEFEQSIQYVAELQGAEDPPVGADGDQG